MEYSREMSCCFKQFPTPLHNTPQPAGVQAQFLGKTYVICGSQYSYIHLVDLPNNSFQSSQRNPLPQSHALLELTISFSFHSYTVYNNNMQTPRHYLLALLAHVFNEWQYHRYIYYWVWGKQSTNKDDIKIRCTTKLIISKKALWCTNACHNYALTYLVPPPLRAKLTLLISSKRMWTGGLCTYMKPRSKGYM